MIAGIGRTWVDEILHAAKLSPFKRGDDLSEEEAGALRKAMVGELGRVIEFYEDAVQLPLPEKFPKPTRVHAHQGEPCPRCETTLEAVFYEDYVMSYCPQCQTEGASSRTAALAAAQVTEVRPRAVDRGASVTVELRQARRHQRAGKLSRGRS